MMASNPTAVTGAGWNTWDYRGLNRFVFLRDDRFELTVRVLFVDELERALLEDFSWGDLREVGPHAPDGSYMRCELQAGFEAQFRIEAAAEGPLLLLDVVPTRASGKRVVVEIGEPGASRHRRRPGGLEIGSWQVAVHGEETDAPFFVALDHPYVVGRPGERLRVAIEPAGDRPAVGAEELSSRIAAARARYEETAARGSGCLAGMVEAMLRGMCWNTVYDLSGRGVCTPVSRHWSRNWRGVVLFGWDTFLGGLMAGIESPSLALANFRAVLAGATPEGFVPNWRLSSGAYTPDRSQPPVGALAVEQAAVFAGDAASYASLLEPLRRWHRWWPEARDGNGDGLLEWGSSPRRPWRYPQLKQVLYGEQICACYESGMDNSPLFDGVPYDRSSGTLRQADVGLNSLHVADGQALGRLADRLGIRDAEIDAIEDAAEQRRRAIDARLWCEEQRLWVNRTWEGACSDRIAPTSLYPLLCGGVAAERAACALAAAADPRRLGGPWPLPSIARADPAWGDNDYWRGRVWPPMNFLALEGMRRVGCEQAADDIATRGLEMFRRGWDEGNRIYENYSSATGEGGDVGNSDPLYTWGGLLVLAAIRRIVAPGWDGGIDFGHLGRHEAGIDNLHFRGRRLSIRSGPSGLTAVRDGEMLIETDAPVRIRGYDPDAPHTPLHIAGPAGAKIRWADYPPGTEVEVVVHREKRRVATDRNGVGELRI